MVAGVRLADSRACHRSVSTSHVEDRMKKTALITLLLGMAVFSSAFAAGGTFGVSGGLAKPTGDFGDL